MKRVGVISDTHGLLRPEAVQVLRGSDLIIHAGDVGSETIVSALGELAPVYAVRGNVDTGAWAYALPLTETLEVEGVALFVHHGHLPLEPDLLPQSRGVVISGHSHRPSIEMHTGVLHLNPGSAGRKRFRLPVSLAQLVIDGYQAEATLVYLEV